MEENRKTTSTEKQHRDFAHGLTLKMAAAANVVLTEATQEVYLEQLVKLTDSQLAEAAKRTIFEWDKPSMMPPLKFILDRTGSNTKLSAEQAWEQAWQLVKRDWYADGIGWYPGTKEKLTPAQHYAIRQCGGEYHMAYSTDKEFPFIRKTFIEAHERFQAEGGEQIRLTHGESVNMLDKLKRGEVDE